MTTDPIAPWGELVPTDKLLTVEDLEALPDDGSFYELVEGRLIRMPPEGGEALTIGLLLGAALTAFVMQHHLGRVTGEQGGYRLAPRTTLAPDVGFMRAERLPPRSSPAYRKAWPGAPDLAVEVASPTQSRNDMAQQAQIWLRHGAQLVWVVWPRRQEVEVWHPGDTRPSRTLDRRGTLDGEHVLPGFAYQVADLFV
jgi:Uma2 family endonuclease